MQFQRYAIYYTPKPSPLAEFGAAWLGWDMAAGKTCPHLMLNGLPISVNEITATPRKYGMHGTIKPPFFLAQGTSFAALQDALATLCATLPAVTLPALTLERLGSFLALKISGDQSPLAQIAADTVKTLDIFRAHPTEAELSRRRQSNLSTRQEELLAQWGYPYVMDEFRFHITLTGRLSQNDLDRTAAVLSPVLTPLITSPFLVNNLTLVGQDSDGMFHEIQRYALTG